MKESKAKKSTKKLTIEATNNIRKDTNIILTVFFLKLNFPLKFPFLLFFRERFFLKGSNLLLKDYF